MSCMESFPIIIAECFGARHIAYQKVLGSETIGASISSIFYNSKKGQYMLYVLKFNQSHRI